MDNSELTSHLCRVCGLFHEDPPWGVDGKAPTYVLCDCCGVEFGYQDVTATSTTRFREAWLSGGATWFNEKKKPEEWDLSAQLGRIDLRGED